MFENIDILFKKIKQYPPLKQSSLQRIMEDFAISYTYNSNAIEGNTLTERETYLIIKDNMSIEGKPLNYQMDVVGHQKAFNYIQSLATVKQSLTEETIKEIHRMVLISNAEAGGRYRDVDVYISGSDVILPSAEHVPDRMRLLIEQHNTVMQDWHIVRRTAMFHLLFESVHPFVDGNGRTGRLLINLDLLDNGYPPIDVKLQDRQRYYYCLQAFQGSDENELPMQQMVSEYLEHSLAERLAAVEKAYKLSKSQPER